MQVNPFDQHYIGQFSLASEDTNDAGSRKCCCNSKNIKRIILMKGL